MTNPIRDYPDGKKIDGDKTTWHIRLMREADIITPTGKTTIEVWQLWNGDNRESSLFPKRTVAEWRDEELAKGRKS